jgi:citrate lyase subunit beta/citryl-CoA lyase
METGTRMLVRRSLLVVSPLDDGELLNAARSAADAIVVDLASRVPKARRDDARRSASAALQQLAISGAQLLLWTDVEGVASDLAACGLSSFAGVIVAVDAPEAVQGIDAALTLWESANNVPNGTLTIEVVLASAKAVQHAEGIAIASQRTVALALDDEKLLGEMGVAAFDTLDRLLYCRGKMVVAARSAGVQAHALGHVAGEAFDRAVAGRQAGLRGALCFDPTKASSINDGFSLPAQELEAARQVLEAMQVAVDGGRGAVAVSSGQMTDLANARGAQAVIEWSNAVQEREATRIHVDLSQISPS